MMEMMKRRKESRVSCKLQKLIGRGHAGHQGTCGSRETECRDAGPGMSSGRGHKITEAGATTTAGATFGVGNPDKMPRSCACYYLGLNESALSETRCGARLHMDALHYLQWSVLDNNGLDCGSRIWYAKHYSRLRQIHIL